MSISRLEEIRKIRLGKLAKLRRLGIDPYPPQSSLDLTSVVKARDAEGQTLSVAGRLWRWRQHGQVIFADLKDSTGQIQLLFQSKKLADKFDVLKLFDVGDFLAVSGEVIKTSAGEITIDVDKFELLSKSLRPLPDDWHGLKDVEDRFRKRYLDLLVNPEVKSRLEVRTKIISSIREFLDNKGFLEVETPTLQPIYGGGFAKPFVTHHNVLDCDFYLRISDEMYLKRLIVGGFEKVYEITKVFRNEGVDYDHNPEFTMFEAMIAFEDYEYGMDLIEEIFEHSAKKVLGKTKINFQGKELDVKRPWNRYKYVEAIQKFCQINPLDWKTLAEAKLAAKALNTSSEKLKGLEKTSKIGEVIAFVFEEVVEEKLIEPTIIYDYPIEISPLAKKCSDPRFTQRFEMFAFGSELGNNYTELNDPVDLYQRFVEEKKREKAGFEEAHQTDYDYLEAIEHGFPPTCGIAIGIDRMVMLFTNAPSIKEVILFPTLRPENVVAKPKTSPSTKDYSISNEVRQKFPGISFAYTIIKGVKIKKLETELEKLKKLTVESKKSVTLAEVSEITSIRNYRTMLKTTGVDTGSRRPSPEALMRRIIQGKNLYNINTAVDAYNLAVLETNIGLGGFDLAKVSQPVVLRFSRSGEEMHLLGDEEKTKTKDGELVYADTDKLLTLDLNYRDIDATKITEKTKDVILFADGGPDISPDDVVSALKKGASYIQKFCGGQVGEIILVQ
ncbi:MAG: Lysine-tRNA ligase [Microgenomates group bacterium GW2011_GWC1_46_20]|nr:MAG: Lysine-tRNA ligase [Microgenomates group bacterium GW2011_GWC1_46_20]